MKDQKVCWITGASSGIGAALSLQLAREGYIVAISARSQDKLIQLSNQKFNSGRLVPYPLDVTDRESIEPVITNIFNELGNIDLAIFCAGTYISDREAVFDPEDIEKQFQLNVMGTIYPLGILLKKHPPSHIAIVASVAGYRGLPNAMGYSATKAALIAMTESLKINTAKLGIKVQLICPGFVRTPLTDKNTFPMPFLISAEEAALAISKGLKSSRFEIVFPWPMMMLMKFIHFLPASLYFWIMKRSISG